MAAAKQERRNWRIVKAKYIHGGATEFLSPSFQDAKQTLDRVGVREDDTAAKLISKQYANKHRGAKQRNITTGNKVGVAIPQTTKTDPTFMKSEYTVLTREGAKVVLITDGLG